MRTHLKRGDPRHGTLNGYGNYGCRCRRCKAEMAEYNRKRRRGQLRGGGVRWNPPEPEHTPPDGWRFRCLKCGQYYFDLDGLDACLNGGCPAVRMSEAS